MNSKWIWNTICTRNYLLKAKIWIGLKTVWEKLKSYLHRNSMIWMKSKCRTVLIFILIMRMWRRESKNRNLIFKELNQIYWNLKPSILRNWRIYGLIFYKNIPKIRVKNKIKIMEKIILMIINLLHRNFFKFFIEKNNFSNFFIKNFFFNVE